MPLIRSSILPLLAAVVLCAPACRKAEPPAGRVRVAVAPFENQTPDASWQWLAGAGQAMTVSALSKSGAFSPVSVSSPAGATAVRATQILHGYLTSDPRGATVHFWLEDLASRKMVRTAEAAGPPGDIVRSFQSALKAIAPDAGSIGTENLEALRAWGEAIRSSNRDELLVSLNKVTQADPDFGQAWILLAQSHVAAGDRAQALAAVDQALARQTLRGDLERAQLEVVQATLASNEDARLKALDKLAQQSDDPAALLQLGEAYSKRGNFAEAAKAYERAAAIPDAAATIWNTLGYVYARAGNLDRAVAALEKYRQSGDAANALDSLGEVHFEHGRFDEAIRYFQESVKANPRSAAGLEKAAFAAYLKGDAAQAGKLYEDFLKTQQGALEERRAQWAYLNGKRAEARAKVEALSRAGGSPFAHSLAVLWHLEAGDRAGAIAAWERLAKTAQGPWAGLAQVLAAILGKVPPQGPTQEAYGAIFRRDYARAAGLWSELAGQSGSVSAGISQGLAAVARVAARQAPESFGALYPLPPTGFDSVMTTLLYPEFLRARGAWLRSQGKNGEAEGLDRLYRQYRGDGASAWSN